MNRLWMVLTIVAPSGLAAGQAEQLRQVTGTVERFLLTPGGDVDGLLLASGTIVRFPPHLGVAVASVARPGDQATVLGWLGPRSKSGQAMRAMRIENQDTRETVIDGPPKQPVPLESPRTRLTIEGVVARLLVNEHGEVDGAILATGDQARFPPGTGGALTTSMGLSVRVSGLGTRGSLGTCVEPDRVEKIRR
jgi:hypothetical protein